eukprot:gene9203-biopygen1654
MVRQRSESDCSEWVLDHAHPAMTTNWPAQAETPRRRRRPKTPRVPSQARAMPAMPAAVSCDPWLLDRRRQHSSSPRPRSRGPAAARRRRADGVEVPVQ